MVRTISEQADAIFEWSSVGTRSRQVENAEVAPIRRVAREADGVADESRCRGNGTCGRCTQWLQGGEGDRYLCASKLRKGDRNVRNPYH
ncbi:hypothetical protein D9M71_709520 [compost metagenome]